jgi:hypothetical protein
MTIHSVDRRWRRPGVYIYCLDSQTRVLLPSPCFDKRSHTPTIARARSPRVQASGSGLGSVQLLPQAQAIPRLSASQERARCARYDVDEWRAGE